MNRRLKPMRLGAAPESLEPRSLLTAGASLSHFLASSAAARNSAQIGAPVVTTTSHTVTSKVAPAAAPTAAPLSQSGDPSPVLGHSTASIRDLIAPPVIVSTPDSRWDWLAGTAWYVPTENLLAYATNSDLSVQLPVADQTLWFIDQASGGVISGEAVVKLSISSQVSQMSFTGVVTAAGQVRLQFDNSEQTIGVGQMRFVDGAWRIEMQMATGSGLIVTHWAYMSQLMPDVTPPDPTGVPNGSLLSNEWRWLEGTRWAISDTGLFGGGPGVFQIDAYRNGYFWGSGTSGQPFNVMGSVTPEGNLLLIVSQSGGQPISRIGILQQTSAAGGVMTLRSYEGSPAIGRAVTIPPPGGAPAVTARMFLASRAR